jgi:hypothetical protein
MRSRRRGEVTYKYSLETTLFRSEQQPDAILFTSYPQQGPAATHDKHVKVQKG